MQDNKYAQRLSSLANALYALAYNYNACKHTFCKNPEDAGIVVFLANESKERWTKAEDVVKAIQAFGETMVFTGVPEPVKMQPTLATLQELEKQEAHIVLLLGTMLEEAKGLTDNYPGYVEMVLCEMKMELKEVSDLVAEVKLNMTSAFKMRVLNDQLLRLYAE